MPFKPDGQVTFPPTLFSTYPVSPTWLYGYCGRPWWWSC